MAETSSEAFKSGFVALVGRPSVGKSTLVNACVGEKVAITSPVAQTTRRRLRAVVNTENAQIIIVDTPGLHKPKDALGKELNKAALGELADVDVAAFLIDATRPEGRGDEWVAKHVEASPAPFKLLVITKADIATPEQVSSQLEAARALMRFDDELVVSAAQGFNVDAFVDIVSRTCPKARNGSPTTWPPTPRTRSSSASTSVRRGCSTAVRRCRTRSRCAGTR
jgi:GTP-binding protein Era